MRGGAAYEQGNEGEAGGAIPCPYHGGLAEAERQVVDGWWRGLPAGRRRHLAMLADPRADSCAYHRELRRDGSTGWYGVAIELRGGIADDEGAGIAVEGEDEAFPVDLYEYLVGHEITPWASRVFHVCTAHEAARAALRAGRIPASFACPFGRPECPMRRLLGAAPGRSLRREGGGRSVVWVWER